MIRTMPACWITTPIQPTCTTVHFSTYVNSNGDRTITPDEATFLFNYGGWLGNPFNQAAYEANRLYADDLSNTKTDEFVIGFEREVVRDMSVAVNYTYRKYTNIYGKSGINDGVRLEYHLE